MQVNMVIFKRDGQRKDISLAKPVSVIGRRDDCDLRVPLLGVSRQHCQVIAKDGKVTLKDLNSSNGTFVNDKRVNQQDLKPGDRVQVGPVTFVIQIEGKPAKISPPMKPKKASATARRNEEVDVELAAEDDAFAQLVMGDRDADDDEDPISALEALADQKEEDKDDV
jgi:pSer/pThr/pTyr-binding forkhead associated (FHA) protein